MGAARKLNERYDEPVDSISYGGNVEEILKRLNAVESVALENGKQISGIVAVLPHLATKADVSAVRGDVLELRAEVSGIAATIPHLSTKEDVRSSEVRVVRWIIGIIISCMGLAFSIGKFVH